MKRRLNLFQSTMLRWRALHPYNAVHVVRVDASFEDARLSECIREYLEASGLTGLVLDREAGRYEWEGGAATATLHVIHGGDDPDGATRAEIERQLNLAYPHDGRFDPFRFFAVVEHDSFQCGVTYDHFVAAGDAIAGLLRGVVGRYCGETTDHAPRVQPYAPSYAGLFVRQVGALLAGLGSLPSMTAACRRSFRPRYAAVAGDHTAFIAFRLDAQECDALRAASAAWGVTRNDIFLALLLKCISPLAADRRREPRRKELGVASIVNIRRDFDAADQASFGPVLASLRVSHCVPDGVDLRTLAAAVKTETSRVKRKKLYLQSLLALGLVGLQWRYLTDAQRRGIFAKSYAVWAGTTPLNVTSLWTRSTPAASAEHKDGAVDYIRAVPTGPLAPIAMAVTTAGAGITVGVSFRTAAFDRVTIDALTVAIRQNLTNFKP